MVCHGDLYLDDWGDFFDHCVGIARGEILWDQFLLLFWRASLIFFNDCLPCDNKCQFLDCVTKNKWFREANTCS